MISGTGPPWAAALPHALVGTFRAVLRQLGAHPTLSRDRAVPDEHPRVSVRRGSYPTGCYAARSVFTVSQAALICWVRSVAARIISSGSPLAASLSG